MKTAWAAHFNLSATRQSLFYIMASWIDSWIYGRVAHDQNSWLSGLSKIRACVDYTQSQVLLLHLYRPALSPAIWPMPSPDGQGLPRMVYLSIEMQLKALYKMTRTELTQMQNILDLRCMENILRVATQKISLMKKPKRLSKEESQK